MKYEPPTDSAKEIPSWPRPRPRSSPSSAQQRSRKGVGRIGEEYFLLDLDDILAFQAEREIVWIIAARRQKNRRLHRSRYGRR